jgi:hypothetical protein
MSTCQCGPVARAGRSIINIFTRGDACERPGPLSQPHTGMTLYLGYWPTKFKTVKVSTCRGNLCGSTMHRPSELRPAEAKALPRAPLSNVSFMLSIHFAQLCLNTTIDSSDLLLLLFINTQPRIIGLAADLLSTIVQARPTWQGKR